MGAVSEPKSSAVMNAFITARQKPFDLGCQLSHHRQPRMQYTRPRLGSHRTHNNDQYQLRSLDQAQKWLNNGQRFNWLAIVTALPPTWVTLSIYHRSKAVGSMYSEMPVLAPTLFVDLSHALWQCDWATTAVCGTRIFCHTQKRCRRNDKALPHTATVVHADPAPTTTFNNIIFSSLISHSATTQLTFISLFSSSGINRKRSRCMGGKMWEMPSRHTDNHGQWKGPARLIRDNMVSNDIQLTRGDHKFPYWWWATWN